jgi:hypothetical protein
MKSSPSNRIQLGFCVLIAAGLTWGIATAKAKVHDSKFDDATVEQQTALPQGVSSPSPTPTPSASPTPTPTPNPTPLPQIDGFGSIAAPNGGRDAQFFIFDVEDEQVTPKYLEGEFGFLDKKSHINFSTGKIETVTVNGNQAAFTGTARIGGPKNKQIVQFTVNVTANQTPTTTNTFSIVLSNGYTASGTLTSGQILIRSLDPD